MLVYGCECNDYGCLVHREEVDPTKAPCWVIVDRKGVIKVVCSRCDVISDKKLYYLYEEEDAEVFMTYDIRCAVWFDRASKEDKEAGMDQLANSAFKGMLGIPWEAVGKKVN